jgi:hypothetical protein
MTEWELRIHAQRWAETVEKTPLIVDVMGLTHGFTAIDPQHGHFTVELWQDPKDGCWHILTADTRRDGESSSHPCNYRGY